MERAVIRCLSLLVALIIIVTPGRAAADGPPAAALDEAVGWVLDDLTEKERQALALLAREVSLRGVDAARQALGSRLPSRGNLQQILRKLTAERGWQLAALARLMPPDLFEPSPDRRAINGLLRNLAVGLREGRCKELEAAMREFLAKGDAAPLPLTRDAVAKARDASCLPRQDPRAPDPLQSYVLAAISARTDDDLRVFVTGLGKREPEYLQVGIEESYAPGGEHDTGARVFFLAVPPHHPVTLRASGDRHELPLLREKTPGADFTFDANPSRAACLRLDVKLDENVVLLLDGERKDPGIYSVPLENHAVVGLRKNKNGSYAVTARRLIEEEMLRTSRCLRVDLDLGPPTGSRGEGQVSLVSWQADTGCAAAGIDNAAVKQYAEEALTRPDLVLKPFDEFRSTIDRVTSIKDALSSLPGQAIGAPRGAGTMAALGVAAAELLRQDFGTPISVEVSCRRRGAAGPQEITVTSSLIDLDKILNTAEHNPLTGVRLDELRRSERDTVYDPADAKEAIGITLARLLGHAFIRFIDVSRPKPFELPITLAGEVYAGDRKPQQDAGVGRKLAVRLSWQRLDNDRCRRSYLDCEWDHDSAMEMDTAPSDAPRKTFEVPFDPPSPGLYRVQLALSDGTRDLASTRRLVNVEEPRFRVGFDVGYDAGVWRPAQDARLEQLSYIRAMATADWQWSADSAVWIGISAGYARAGRERAAPASWQDQLQAPAAAPYDDAGQLVHTWVRHAFLLGPVIGARVHPLGWTGWPTLRRLELVARLMPLTTDLGVIDASGVPGALADARANAKGLDPDLSLFLEAGPSVALGPRVNLRWLFHVGLLAYDDLIFNTSEQELRETTRRITNDADLIMGLTIGGEVGP